MDSSKDGPAASVIAQQYYSSYLNLTALSLLQVYFIETARGRGVSCYQFLRYGR